MEAIVCDDKGIAEKKKLKTLIPERNYNWSVHINEGFNTVVKSPNVEGALMQAFAQYWEKHKTPSLLVFDIQVLNLTLYNADQEARKNRQ